LASSSSEAISTSSDWPATRPSSSVPANVVLNAFTTRAPGAAAAVACALDPASTTTGSKASTSSGLVMSTTILPSSCEP
jgi:hypothetical protein